MATINKRGGDVDPNARLLREYFQRIGYAVGTDSEDSSNPALPAPTRENLRLLHRCHCIKIPWENLSVVHPLWQTGEAFINPDFVTAHRKLVIQQQGGGCYDHNELFSQVLTLLGYDCYLGMGHIVSPGSLKPADKPLQGLPTYRNPGSTLQIPGLHKIVFVRFPDGPDTLWLCDTGFGGQGLLEPLPVIAWDDPTGPQESHQAGTKYRIRCGVMGSAEHLTAAQAASHPEAKSHVGYYLQVFLEDAWNDVYYFSLEARHNMEFTAFCFWSRQRHPLLSKTLIATKPTENGRITLTDMTLKIRCAGQPTELIQLQYEEERMAVLEQYFGLRPPSAAAAAGGDAGDGDGAVVSTGSTGNGDVAQAELLAEVLATSEA